MPSNSIYPSIPVPQKTMDSMYETLLLMRQVIQLLIINSQSSTSQNITQAAQVFSKVEGQQVSRR